MASSPWLSLSPQTQDDGNIASCMCSQDHRTSYLPRKWPRTTVSPQWDITPAFFLHVWFTWQKLCAKQEQWRKLRFSSSMQPQLQSHSSSLVMSGWKCGGPNFIHWSSVGRFDFTHGEASPEDRRLLLLQAFPLWWHWYHSKKGRPLYPRLSLGRWYKSFAWRILWSNLKKTYCPWKRVWERSSLRAPYNIMEIWVVRNYK